LITLTQITGYYSADNPIISLANGGTGAVAVSGAVGGAAPLPAVSGQAGVENLTLKTALVTGDTLTITGAAGAEQWTGGALVASGYTTATGQATFIASQVSGNAGLTGLASGATIILTQTSGNYSPTQPTVTLTSDTGGAILSTATTGVATVLTTGTAGVENVTIGAALQGADTLTVSGAAGSQTFAVAGGILSGITSATGQAAAIAAALSGNTTLGLAVTASNGVLTLAQTTGSYSDTQPNVTVAGGGQGVVSNAVVTTGVATDTGEAAYAFGVTTNFGANDQLSINGTNFTAIAGGTAATGQFVVGASLTASAANLATAITAESATLGYTAAASNSGAITLTSTTVGLSSGAPTVALSNTALATNLQVGANQNQMMAISISDARSAALGVAGTASAAAAGANGNVSGAYFTDGAGNNIMSDYTTAGEGALDVTSQTKASAAITVIDEAISGLSTQNSLLGAYQDRLQDTSDNLTSGSQNLTSANAQLVDVDMASEMSQYTQDSILVQAATAMLAQAQQEPQSVLKLLG
jgi:flagellin